MTVSELIAHLQEILMRYPEYANEPIRVQSEDSLFEGVVTTTELANGPWIIIEQD